ncbi:MAG: alpha/beta fold hydrolase [Holophagales bacterium]|nr:alpha/beta fold hydrolase [Holophagales bacterium]
MSTPNLSAATTPSTPRSVGVLADAAGSASASCAAQRSRVEGIPRAAELEEAAPEGASIRARGSLDLPSPLPLHHGGRLERPRLAYELVGPPNAPVVAALGGISAGRHVAGADDTEDGDPAGQGDGWWAGLVGPGKAVDTRQFRVLSFDWLGGDGGSTGPRQIQEHQIRERQTREQQTREQQTREQRTRSDPADARSFPCVDTRDQARALAELLGHLEIPRLATFLGASYGGMVALAFAAVFPHLVERLVVISAADRPHPRSTAWRSVQRRIVHLASAWGSGHDGLALSRALAMVTYRSSRELEQRFDGPPRLEDGEFRFPVDDYLDARGADFAARFHPAAFVTLSRSIDLHRVDATRTDVPTTLVAITSDQLVPLRGLRRLAADLRGSCHLEELDSLYGHDAFLKEFARLTPIVQRSLGPRPPAPEHDLAAVPARGREAEISTSRRSEVR